MVLFISLCVLVFGLSAQLDYLHICCVKSDVVKSCPSVCTSCGTLTELENCSSSHTTIAFLTGIHSVEEDITFLIVNATEFLITNMDEEESVINATTEIKCLETSGSFGILFSNSTNIRIENVSFTGCSQEFSLLPSTYNYSTLGFCNVTNLTISQVNVSSSSGYGLYAQNVLGDSLIINSCFNNNSGNGSERRGGNADFFYEYCPSSRPTISTLSIHSSQFLNGYDKYSNPIATGLSVMLKCSNVNVDIYDVTLSGNVAESEANISTGGNLGIFFRNWTSIITNSVTVRNCSITDGIAYQGGGMYVNILEVIMKAPASKPTQDLPHFIDVNSTKVVPQFLNISNTRFIGNFAKEVGGGLYIIVHEMTESYHLTGHVIVENCYFVNNTLLPVRDGGIAVHVVSHFIPGHIRHGVPQFNVTFFNCIFSGNFLNGSIHYYSSGSGVVFLVHNPSGVYFTDCTFQNNNCSGIAAIRSNVIFQGNVMFKNNTGIDGGGVVLCDRSYMYLQLFTTITFINNHAFYSGGAIFAEDQCLQSEPACFFQPDMNVIYHQTLLDTIHINMTGNTAGYAGSALYGGSIDFCSMLNIGPYQIHDSGKEMFEEVFTIKSNGSDLSCISSDPIGVCLCDSNNTVDCSNSTVRTSLYPGGTIQVYAVVVGQRNGTVPGDVIVIHSNTSVLAQGQDAQSIHMTQQCTSLLYTVYSSDHSDTLKLYAQRPRLVSVIREQHLLPWIDVSVKPCPLGFTLTYSAQDLPYCDCIHLLSQHKVTCNITDLTIHRPYPAWIGRFSTGSNTMQGIIFHGHCPFDFCKQKDVALKVMENNTLDEDKQCDFHRTGVLCGACSAGYSLVLGTSECGQCPPNPLFYTLLAAFIMAGLLLVILLTACNLTVTEGTINGLIFYANIVQVNHAIFFPPLPNGTTVYVKVITKALTVFIAWLNLDLGIQTCFYNGMDAYAKAWLQFAFPVYIWVITGLIIILSRQYSWVARLMSRNAVKVLATLFLLSYAKLLRTSIIAQCFTFLTYTTTNRSFTQTVWMYDGNIDYLRGKHIPLFILSMAFMILTLPYTFVLLFIGILQRKSDRKMLFWVNKFKPLFDAYTGPYKDRYRCWTGLLLLARLVLFMAFALNIIGEPALNLLATTVACFLLLMLVRGIYKWWVLDVLEASFLLNTGILSAATAITSSSGTKAVIAYSSVSIAFATFILICFFHAYKQTLSKSHKHNPQQAPQNLSQPPVDERSLTLTDESAMPWGGPVQDEWLQSSSDTFDRNFREPLLSTIETSYQSM